MQWRKNWIKSVILSNKKTLTPKTTIMLTKDDIALLSKKGITEKQIEEQLQSFAKGFPYLEIQSAASPEKGITGLSEELVAQYCQAWDNYLDGERQIVKFVPASGAASRMFKDLFEFLDSTENAPQSAFEKKFFEQIKQFAFYNDLNDACVKADGQTIDELIGSGKYKTVVTNLLSDKGLNYGNLPKGLLRFHKYGETARTPMEEQMVEGALYAANKSGRVKVHFTVSGEHKPLFEQLVGACKKEYESKYGIVFEIAFSEQKSSTDTLAADAGNQPFRDKGELLFRPGGHGALIENLNDTDADIVFIKNIDNVVPDRLKADTVTYKKAIAGMLVSLQKQAHDYLRLIDSGKYSSDDLREIIHFLQDKFCTRNAEMKNLEDAELAIYLRKKLNRPIRVCGMVRNVGEPGGGPFITQNSDGTWSLQILESSQIDLANPEKKAMFENSTHFNPVDLVCAVRDYKGEKFDLTKYVDKNTGFISLKSKNGKELKALELPGLWNGAMSDWNTAFAEVPIETFNPVKTVNDLLRNEHQG